MALKRNSLPEQIQAQLRKEIFTGAHKAGQCFPSERELAERFGTSRITVRKALAALAQEGWIDIVQGKGNIVKDFNANVGIESLPWIFLSCPEEFVTPEVFELCDKYNRWIHEEIVGFAARKAKPQDAPRLTQMINQMRVGMSSEEYWEIDSAYVSELIKIGGNMFLNLYYNSQMKFLKKLFSATSMEYIPWQIDLYKKLNRQLIPAICLGNEQKARSIIRKYEKEMRELLLRLFMSLKEAITP